MNERKPKAAITVSEMCELLEMSRSQVYLHIKRGRFMSHCDLPMVVPTSTLRRLKTI